MAVRGGRGVGGLGGALRGYGPGVERVKRVWAHLVPVLGGLIDLLHRAWLELIDEPARRRGGH